MDRAFLGTELKFIVEITASGFSMEHDDFNILLKRGNKQRLFEKSDLVYSDGDYYLCCDTAEFGIGTIQAVITAYVPDLDFPDGLRTEVYKLDLIRSESV